MKNTPVYSARSKPNRKQGIEVFFFSFTQRTIGLVFFVLNLSLDIFVCFSITYMAYFWFHLRLGGLWFEVCVGDIFIKSKIPTYFFHITNTAPRGFLVHIYRYLFIYLYSLLDTISCRYAIQENYKLKAKLLHQATSSIQLKKVGIR